MKVSCYTIKPGDVLRCDHLSSWNSHFIYNSPMGICDGREVTVTRVKESDGYPAFEAEYEGTLYGFSLTSVNSYTLVTGAKCGSSIIINVPKL